MEQKITRIPVLLLTLVLSAVGYFLRGSQLKAMAQGAAPVWPLVIVSVVAVALFALCAWPLRSRRKYGSISSRELPLMILSVAAAVAMLLRGVTLAVDPLRKGDMLVAVGAMVTAVCWAGVTLARYQGKKAHAALFLLPAVYFVVELICQFRFWTRDPVILDYCFDLFAGITTMFAVFHLGGYTFDQGKRRVTTFFSLAAVFFTAVSMAGTSFSDLVGCAAVILWLLGSLWLLLRPGKSR